MAGRANQGVGVVDPAIQHRVQRFDDAPGRQQGDLVAAMSQRRAQPAFGVHLFALSLDVGDVLGGVETQQFFLGSRAGLDRDEGFQQPADIQQVTQPAFGFGVFRMFARLHRIAERHHAGKVGGAVPGVEFMPDEAGSTRHLDLSPV